MTFGLIAIVILLVYLALEKRSELGSVEELAQAMRLEMGAPITMAREAQADAAIGHLDGFVAALEKLEEQERFENGEVLLREPIGVCGLITP